MDTSQSIIIGDESALFFHLHTDGLKRIGASITWDNPLIEGASSSPNASSFNSSHPLFGGEPITLLVGDANARRRSRRVTCRTCPTDLPQGSFIKLRNNLFIASPELTFARMGSRMTEFQLAEVGMNLCARYYSNIDTDKPADRSTFLTTPEKLGLYLDRISSMRGAKRARSALRWVISNSASSAETKMKLQYCTPLWAGGMGVPFTHMNYDVKAEKLSDLMSQSKYCIDLVNPVLKKGMEYDGEDSHQNPSKDKRRLNELRTLGWDLFPIDKAILYNPDATYKSGFQIRQYLGIRGRLPKNWEKRFIMLRNDLGLPI